MNTFELIVFFVLGILAVVGVVATVLGATRTPTDR